MDSSQEGDKLISVPRASDSDEVITPAQQDSNSSRNDRIFDKIKISSNKWWPVRIIYLTMFIYAVSFTIVITNLYPYLRTLNSDVDKAFYGWVVTAFSIGQFFSAPLFGLWYHYRNAREVFIFSIILSTLANIIYAYAYLFSPTVALYVILLTRFLIGFAFGSASVMRAFIATATTEKERTDALANLNATRSIGFFIGPLIGMAFQPIGYPGYTIPYIQLRFNLYTSPAYFLCFLGLVNLISFIWFKEISVYPKTNSRKNKPNEETPLINETPEKPVLPPADKIAIIMCIIQLSLFSAVWCSFETLTTPYSMDEFAWTNQQAIIYNNIIFAVNGILALCAIISVKFLVKYFQERSLHITGLVLLAIAIYIYIPWPGDLPSIKPGVLTYNGSLVANATHAAGCDYQKQAWCLYVPKLREFQFWLAPILFSISFPMSGILLLTIYSKVLGPHPPGFYMGVITSAGALARIVGPAFFSHLYQYTGPQITFAVIVGVVILAVLLYLIFYRRMVPFTRKYPAFRQN